jgi:PEP-CTERM motif
MGKSLWIIALLFVAIGAPAAYADSYNFSLTDGANLITFILPANPSPDRFTQGTGFSLFGVSVWVNGSLQIDSMNFYDCGASCSNLNLYISQVNGVSGSDLLYQGGAMPVFTGTDSQPIFSLGTFYFTNAPHSTPMTFNSDFTLTISAVPEPATWILFLAGAGLLGLMMVMRKRIPLGPSTGQLNASLSITSHNH